MRTISPWEVNARSCSRMSQTFRSGLAAHLVILKFGTLDGRVLSYVIVADAQRLRSSIFLEVAKPRKITRVNYS